MNRFAALMLALVVCSPSSFSQVFATSVDGDGNGTVWMNESFATGSPGTQNCDGGGAQFANSTSGTIWLTATNFTNVNIPADRVVTSVIVGVHCRYNTGDFDDARVRALWTGNQSTANSPVNQVFTFAGSGGDCNWREIDITGFEASWTQAEINSIQVRIRRTNTVNGNNLRVKAFRIRVQTAPDCNANGIPDSGELAGNDCQSDGIPDDCQLANNDCNADSVPDTPCQLAGNDCQPNGVPDDCELAANDCNMDNVPDNCQLAGNDCDFDQIPDDCQTADCDGDGIYDPCDSPDCNFDDVPDNCQLNSTTDCDGNNTLDECETNSETDCNEDWILDECQLSGNDCNGNNVFDFCELDFDTDCDDDGILDECQLAGNDCDGNGFLDHCEIDQNSDLDCDQTGVLDACESFTDCNANMIPDECDTALFGNSDDCNFNETPDECEPDCNNNNQPDECDLFDHMVDCNNNGVLDECEPIPDCDNDGEPDACEFMNGSEDCDSDGVPDECQPDCDQNFIPDACEVQMPLAVLDNDPSNEVPVLEDITIVVTANDNDFDPGKHRVEVISINEPQKGQAFEAAMPGAMTFTSSGGGCGGVIVTYHLVPQPGCDNLQPLQPCRGVHQHHEFRQRRLQRELHR